jgi:phosphoglycerate dehydrogenase-like enzyme
MGRSITALRLVVQESPHRRRRVKVLAAMAFLQFMAGIESWWVEPFSHGEFRTKHPFFELSNFLGCPHNCAKVPGIMREATLCAVENVIRFLNREPLRGLVKREDYVGLKAVAARKGFCP